ARGSAAGGGGAGDGGAAPQARSPPVVELRGRRVRDRAASRDGGGGAGPARDRASRLRRAGLSTRTSGLRAAPETWDGPAPSAILGPRGHGDPMDRICTVGGALIVVGALTLVGCGPGRVGGADGGG